MTDTMLTFFYVRVPEEMAHDTDWRLRHADETVQVAGAHFTQAPPAPGSSERRYLTVEDGCYEVRALSRSNTEFVRQMLTQHEGLIIDREGQHPADLSAFLITEP